MLETLGNRILLEPIEAEQGTIILTNSKPTQYRIVDFGSDCYDVSIDDIVYIARHSGAEIEHNKKKYLVIKQDDILARVTEAVNE